MRLTCEGKAGFRRRQLKDGFLQRSVRIFPGFRVVEDQPEPRQDVVEQQPGGQSWRVAFLEARALPLGLRGPVLLRALCRFAAFCGSSRVVRRSLVVEALALRLQAIEFLAQPAPAVLKFFKAIVVDNDGGDFVCIRPRQRL